MHTNLRKAFAAIFAAMLFSAVVAYPQHSGIPHQHPGMPRGEKHESRHEIERLEEAWREAVLKGDAVTMDSLLSDDYIAISPRGTLQTKDQVLDNLRKGRLHLTALDISDRKMRFYGTTALVISLAQVAGTNAAGEDISGSFRYTRVYVRNAQGKWKMVSFEASRVREPGEAR